MAVTERSWGIARLSVCQRPFRPSASYRTITNYVWRGAGDVLASPTGPPNCVGRNPRLRNDVAEEQCVDCAPRSGLRVAVRTLKFGLPPRRKSLGGCSARMRRWLSFFRCTNPTHVHTTCRHVFDIGSTSGLPAACQEQMTEPLADP